MTLAAFRSPSAVAVVGASDDPTKWGHWLARGALAGADRRRVYFVNTRGSSVLGQPAFRTLAEIPESPELVTFAVPGRSLPAAVDDALAVGSHGLLAIAADVADETALAERVRAAGVRLIGPNCLGIYDAESELTLAWGRFEPGALAIVSQSGQLGLEIAGLAARAGLGVSRFVSVGSQIDVSAAEVLADLVDHQRTRVVAVYLENFADGPAVLAAVDTLRAAGKRVLLLTVGSSAAAQQAARSHTGSMTSALDVVDAAVRSVGAIRVDTPTRLVAAAQLLALSPPLNGRRTAVLADSGGQAALAADVLTHAGLEVVDFPESVQTSLRTRLSRAALTANPIDLAGAGEQDLTVYGAVVDELAASAAVDAIVLTGYFGSYGHDTAVLAPLEITVAKRIGAAAGQHRVPVLVHSMASGTDTLAALRGAGVPTFSDIETAVDALAAALRLAEPIGSSVAALEPIRVSYADGSGYFAARTALGRAGIPFPEGGVDPTQKAGPGPYVVKADWLEHKSEQRGVMVNLADADAVRRCLDDMTTRLGPGRYVVESMDIRADVQEIIVAARRDPSFGPTVVIGAGGVLAELLRDTVTTLVPCSREEARRLIERLRCYPLLAGWRGRPGVDIDALVDIAVTLGAILVGSPELAEIELNPVRVGPHGALAVDALIVNRAR
jgi:acyl-CoA synthetase (NDP forming)